MAQTPKSQKRTRGSSESPPLQVRRSTRKRAKPATPEESDDDERVASPTKTRTKVRKTPATPTTSKNKVTTRTKARTSKKVEDDTDEEPEPVKKTPATPTTSKKKVTTRTKARTSKKVEDDSDEEPEPEKITKKGKGKTTATVKTTKTSKPSTVVMPKMTPLENRAKTQFENEFYTNNQRAPSVRRILQYLEGQRVAAQAWLNELGIEQLEAILRKFIYDHNIRSARPAEMTPIYQHLGITGNLFAQDLVKVRTLLL
jgi:hypothetical protein